jgi:hypothetical protein
MHRVIYLKLRRLALNSFFLPLDFLHLYRKNDR